MDRDGRSFLIKKISNNKMLCCSSSHSMVEIDSNFFLIAVNDDVFFA